ncbi:MAG TPA: extensin family protein [Kofleriaceae bacterium]|nr:extensin family protein [Kofleriaceae bacterium]
MARIAAVVCALALAGVLASAISAPAEATVPSFVPPSDAMTSATQAAARTKNAKTKPGETKAKGKRTVRKASSDPHMTTPGDAEATPAVHYGQLSQADCEAELGARHVDFIRETASSVLAPVRLTGPLHGVVFRSDARDSVRATSPYEIADCRLVLALDDFAQILARHDIVEVRHYSMYRPQKSSDGAIGTRHPGALAIDAGRFIDRSGVELDVDRDFHGAIDAKTCGEGAGPHPATDAALALRAILCETVDARLFNVVLTPNYNRPHKNHFHLEVTAGVSWFLVH